MSQQLIGRNFFKKETLNFWYEERVKKLKTFLIFKNVLGVLFIYF